MKNNEVFAIGAPLDMSIRVSDIAIESTLYRSPTLRWPQEYISGLYRYDPLFIGRTAKINAM